VRAIPVAWKLSTIQEQYQRPNLFVSKRKLRRGHKIEKAVLGLSPGENVFCTLDTKHDRRLATKPDLFVSARRL
jgi:hypothetical protein